MPDATTQPALRARGLVKAFPGRFGLGRREVLHGIDLDLERGALLGLVGPNGSGKTTLLRAIAGLERIRGGELSVLGGRSSDAAVRRRIGFLSELSPFPPELSARAALDLLAALQGVARADRRQLTGEWLERLGLSDAARRPLGRFSKGMLRRFGLAQALLHAPDLVLLDEPTAGLDALGVALLDELLEEALSRGAAVVLASHLFGDVFDRAGALCVLIDGRVAARGAPADLVADGGRVRIELSNASPDTVARIVAFAEQSGARAVAVGPGSGALLALYKQAAERAE